MALLSRAALAATLRPVGPARRAPFGLGRAAALAGALVALGAPAGAQLTQEAALEMAFPGAERVERRTAYLDDDQLARAAQLAGPDVEMEAGIVTYYVAMRGNAADGVAYFDPHRVRTLPEVLMIVIGTDDRVRRVEVVSFREPPEYRAPDGWLRQFDGRRLDADLSLKGEIANLTGATLTAGAVTRATRRVLALHQVIEPFRGGDA